MNSFTSSRAQRAVVVFLGLTWFATVHAVEGSANIYPAFGACDMPNLPQSWTSKALLMPYRDQELQVAKLQYDSSLEAMRVTTAGVESGDRADWLIVGDESWKIVSKGASLSCEPVTAPVGWQVPSTDWMCGQACVNTGSTKVLDKDTTVWKCPTAAPAGYDEAAYDWFWFSDDAAALPNRFLLSTEYSNTQRFPVIGDSSMVHFTDFQASSKPPAGLAALVKACKAGKSINQQVPTPAITGVTSCGSITTPKWPDTAIATGILYAISGGYTAMAIYYDWPNRRSNSKIKSQDGMVSDNRLTKVNTYTINHTGDTYSCDSADMLGGVGIWNPEWPSLAHCQCKATFKGSPFNTDNTATNALSCYFGSRDSARLEYMMAWFSENDRPVMFYESNAVDLDLIDYHDWKPNAKVDDKMFDEPAECMELLPSGYGDLQSCAVCHDNGQW